ncbi:MAG: CoA-binding protein [Bacteroidetes bacterium]|nr:MAG: CoA-binding protein [Bacteroidota bacterium]
MKKTLILGASPNRSRMSWLVARDLIERGHEVVLVGNRAGEISGVPIHIGPIPVSDVDTVTLYLNPERQKAYFDYILNLKPRRLIFNPGTEHAELARLAREAGIEVVVACTRVMLAVGDY